MPESLQEEIRILCESFWSERDPEGRAFAPLADVYLRSGEVEKAEQLVREGLERHPDFATGHLVAARIARARGDVAQTREHAERVLALDAGNALARIERAAASVREGDDSAAVADLRSAIRVAPGGVEALPGLVASAAAPELDELTGTAVAQHTGETGGEARSLEDATGEARPTGADEEPAEVSSSDGSFVTRTMGDLYASQGLTERAVEVYEQLVRADPENAELAATLNALEVAPPSGPPPGRSGSPMEAPVDVEPPPGEAAASGELAAVAEPDPPIADHVEELLAWVPGDASAEGTGPGADMRPATIEDPGGEAGAARVHTGDGAPGVSPEPPTPSGQRDTEAEGTDEFTRWLKGLQS